MSESEKVSGELRTLEEGAIFADGYIPKVINLD